VINASWRGRDCVPMNSVQHELLVKICNYIFCRSLERPGREADRSPLTIAEVKNAWCFVKHRDNFTSYIRKVTVLTGGNFIFVFQDLNVM